MDSMREHALLCFEQEFIQRDHPGIPQGLKHILGSFCLKRDESPADGRKRLYKRLFGILWFGNKVGKGRFSGKSPTYIYPECAKKVICAIVEEDLKEYDDPHSSKVYHVTVDDLYHAKWPALPKKEKK